MNTKNSFWPRTIREWNKLPPAVLDINNTELFQNETNHVN